MAKEFLSQNKIHYSERNVAYDSDAAAEMVRLSGQRGVPVIVVDQEVVVGFDRPRLERLLAGRKPGVSLGLRVTDAAKVAMKEWLYTSAGAYVDRVKLGSMWQGAGVQHGERGGSRKTPSSRDRRGTRRRRAGRCSRSGRRR